MSTFDPISRRSALRLIGLGGGAALLAACQQAAPAAPTAGPTAAPVAKPTDAPKPAAPAVSTAPAAPAATTAPATTTAPAQGTPSSAKFRVDENVDVTTLNPLLVNATATRRRALLLFSGLYQYDAQNKIVSDLADALPQMPDPLTYVVKLKPNARFHSGKALTADDVKFTYEQVLNPQYGSIWRSHVEPAIESITARDAQTVEIKLKRPYGPMQAKLALIPIVNSQQSKDDLAIKPDGTGPFKFVAYQKGAVLELARNESYHFPGMPKIAQLSVNVVPENPTRYANLANGVTQLAPEPSFNDIALLKGRGIIVNSVASPASTYGYINFKRADGPMTNKNLRRALAYAMDRQAVVDNIWAGQGTPGQVFIRPELWVFDPNFKPWSAKPELDKARAALQASGRAGDRIVITTANDDALAGTAVLIQAAGKAAGMNIDLAQVDRAVFIAELQKDTWDMILTDSYTGSNSGLEADAVNSLLVTNASANFGKYSNPEMDREVQAAVFAPTREEALPRFKRVMEIDAEEVPLLTVAYHNYVEAVSPKVKGFQTTALAHYDLRTAELT